MPRNFSRIVLLLGAALLAAAPALHAQQTGAPVRGDVDGDGRVTAADARIVNDYLVGKPVPAGANVRERGDVNGDGRVTAVDAAIIAAAAAGRDVSRFPVGKAAPDAVAVLECTGDVRTSSVECHAPGASAGGARSDIIVGGQNVNVKLTSGPATLVAPDTFQFTVTVQNLLHQAMAADSGTGAANATGVRVFFASGPNVTGGPGGSSITVANFDGTGTYTGTNQKYFQYSGADLGGDGILSPNETSQPRTWKLRYTGSPTFNFMLFLSAPMPYPKGWVDIYPPNNHYSSPDSVFADTMQVGTTLQLQDSVRNPFGGVIPGASVTWTNTGHGHATVNGTGLVSALSAGVDSVIATDGPRSGRVKIVVAGLSVDSTTITANPTTIAAGDTSLITVQVKDEFGHNVTTGGATVVLSTNLGTLKSTAGTGSSVTANDNGNGTYTAKLTHTATGTATVTGTLNGTPIVDNATVTIGAATPANMAVHSANPQTGTAGQPAGSPPGVLVTDTYGNPVSGVSVKFKITSGGGKLSNGGPPDDSVFVNTGANGIATVTSWTLGTVAGTNTNTVQASSTGLTSVNFTASTDPGPAANMVKSAGDGQSATVGTAVATAPAVTITDSYANPVPGVSVTFAVATGGGSVTGSPATTNASGVATVGSWTLGTTAGSNTLNASATGVTTVTFTATGTAGAPDSIKATSTNPQTGTVGVAVGSPPAVHVTDHYGNPVAGVTVNFAVTGGGGSTTGASPSTNASGNATIGSWTPGSTAPGPNTLSATASGGSNPSTTFTVYVPPVAVTDSSQAMGNTTLGSAVAPNLLTNDLALNGEAIAFQSPTVVGANATDRGGTLTLAADGSFTYLPPVGVTGRDSMLYKVGDSHASATAYIKFRFVGKVWYVDGSGSNGNGRDNSPFNSIANAEAVGGAGANDSILVRNSTVAGGTLKNGQWVFGQNPTTAFTTTLNSKPDTLLPTGTRPSIGALTLGSGNRLEHFTGTGGITGSGFGTLTVNDVGINNPSGLALSLTTGTLSGDFTSLISGGGTNNVLLSGVSGTSILGAGGNLLSGASGDGVVISGGAGSFTFPGNVSNGNASTFAVNVSGKTGGAVTFQGSVTGQGISVTGNSSGSNTIVFSGGSKNISSGAASGVFLNNNTGATIQFTNGGLAIATTTGTPFTATGGGTVEVSGSGNTISATGAAGKVVNLKGITLAAGGMSFASIGSSGTVTDSVFVATSVGNTSGSSFTAGSLTVAGTTAGAKPGLALTTNSAPFTFTTVTINGTGGEGIYLNGNTGAVNVNGGNVGNTTSTTGDALAVSGGNAGISVAANLSKSTAGRIANIASHTAGSVTVSGTLSCTSACTGINVASNSGGTIDFTNATQTVNTSATASQNAITLSSNTGATVNFTGGSLAVTSGTGNGFDATGGGTVTVTGSANTITSTGGVALNVNGTTIGSNGLNFRSITATGGVNGIALNNTGSSGGLTVAGTGAANSGGTIQNQTGVGIALTSTFNPKFNNVRVINTVLSGIQGMSVTNFEFTNGSIDQSGDGPTPGASQRESNILFFNNANTTTSVNVTGTVTITGNTFTNALNTGVWISNQGASTISNLVISNNTFTTATTDANAAGGGILIDMQGQGTNITKATFDNNHINNSPAGPAFLFICGNGSVSGATSSCGTPGDATNIINITNNVIVGQVGNPVGAEGIVANMNGRGQGNFNVTGNSITRTDGRAMGVSAFGQVRMTATVANNTIVSTPLFSGTNMEIGADSASGMASFASYTATVTGNNVSGHDGVGIYALARGSSDTLKVKLISNTVAAPISVTSARAGIRVDAGSAAGQPVVCARIESNTTGGSSNGGGSTSPGINFREQTVSGANFGTLRFHNLSPSSGATKAQAESFVSSQNPGSTTGTFGTGGAAALQSTPTYESCSLP